MLIRGVVSSPVRGVVGSGFGEGGLPALPAGFAFSVTPDGDYEVWPDGAYVVEYIG